jgi:trans-2,3-dihydro-3-hydroxyanthranilate isomerase
MRVRVVWWELDGSPATIVQLREYLRDESVDAFAQVEGLRLKMWIADEERNRWGAVYLWESQAASEQPLPSRARQIIGKDPDFEEWFDLEASVEGAFAQAALARQGAAFAGA